MTMSVVRKLLEDNDVPTKFQAGGRFIKTHTGCHLDVLKSAWQKYTRRGHAEGLRWCALESFLLFHVAPLPHSPGVKGAITNIRNRIQTILFEDVSFRECVVVDFVMGRLRDSSSSFNDPSPWLEVAEALAACTKSRCSSHAFAHFSRRGASIPVGLSMEDCVRRMSRALDNMANVTVAAVASGTEERVGHSDASGPGECPVVENVVTMFLLWDGHNKRAFAPLWKMLLRRSQLLNPFITRAIKHRHTYFNARRSFPDERCAVLSATLLVKHYVGLVAKRGTAEKGMRMLVGDADVNPSNFVPRGVGCSDRDLLSHRSYDHPRYVYDKHVREGEPSLKTDAFFLEVSSLIENEDGEIFNPTWSNTYLSRKSHTNRKRKAEEDAEAELPVFSADFTETRVMNGRSRKAPCLRLPTPTKIYVLKEMRPSFDYGRDQACAHHVKGDVFNLASFPASRQKWPYKYSCETGKCEPVQKPPVYFVMEAAGGDPQPLTLSSKAGMSRLLRSETLQFQLFQIVIFRLLLGVSDTNTRNVLLPRDSDTLFSVDENFIGSWAVNNNILPTKVEAALRVLRGASPRSRTMYENAFRDVWGESVREERLRLTIDGMKRYRLVNLAQKIDCVKRNGCHVKKVCDKFFYKMK